MKEKMGGGGMLSYLSETCQQVLKLAKEACVQSQ